MLWVMGYGGSYLSYHPGVSPWGCGDPVGAVSPPEGSFHVMVSPRCTRLVARPIWLSPRELVASNKGEWCRPLHTPLHAFCSACSSQRADLHFTLRGKRPRQGSHLRIWQPSMIALDPEGSFGGSCRSGHCVAIFQSQHACELCHGFLGRHLACIPGRGSPPTEQLLLRGFGGRELRLLLPGLESLEGELWGPS